MKEIEITRAIVESYTERFLDSLESDVIVVGAGPAGMAAAYYLATAGLKTTVVEKRLSTGGGIWGGGIGQNIIVVEDPEILQELGVRHKRRGALFTAGAVELAATLATRVEQAGARIFNLTEAEDVVVKEGAVRGVVINATAILMARLHVDPVCMGAGKVVDATGHAAELVNMLRHKLPDFYPEGIGEGFMDVEPAEQGVVDRAGEVYPGLYVAGMSVCTTHRLPRMGPIFGGMLRSGRKVARMIRDAISGE
ncbi:MAG: sulfide-dependent adenosine diphosphate thiazole synthase [Candidatus Brocadiaceae bacterium]|jgi:thiamine thiazole synthase